MKPKRYYRLPPCPAYDIAGMQAWLEDLARNGLYLEPASGFFCGFGTFVDGTPASVRYRLEAVQKHSTLFDDRDAPDDRALELAEEFGWEYVCRRQEFDIYRTADPLAPDLNTDPALQAQSLKAVEKRLRGAVHTTIFWCLLDPLLSARGGLLQMSIHCGLWLTLWLTCLLLGQVAVSFYRVRFLSRLRKSLQRNESFSRPDNLQKKGLRYHIGHGLHMAAVLMLVVVLLCRWGNGTLDKSEIRQPLNDFSGVIPFATIADFGPENAVYEGEYFHFSEDENTFARWDGPLISDAILWDENAQLKRTDGNSLSGGLQVVWYETRAPWLAKWLAQEIYYRERLQWDVYDLQLPQLEVEYARGFNRYFNAIVLQEGNYVLYAYFYNGGNQTVTLADWVTIMADHFLKHT